MKKISLLIITLVILFTCFSCNITIEKEHTYDGYSYNEEYHWQVCTTCNTETTKEKHNFGVTETSDGKTYTCNVCGYTYIEKNQTEDPTDPVDPVDPDDPVATGFKVTFTHEDKVKVYIYDTQDVATTKGTLSDIAYSKDGDTGELLSNGEGQVNFRLEIEDGYVVDTIDFDETVINNLKTIDSTNLIYRATKIKADTVISISIKEAGSDDPDEPAATGFKVTFTHTDKVKVYIYDTQDVATTKGTLSDIAYSKDGDTGALLSNGDGQVNFRLEIEDGYEIDTINFDETVIKNLKVIDSSTLVYRATKITADTTIEIVIKEEEPAVVIEAYKVTFTHSTNATVIVYDTQDTTATGTTTDIAYSKDGDTGAYLKDGEGQVNFKVVLSDAELEIKNIKFDNTAVKNLKVIDEANHIYRATKITADTTIEIEVGYAEGNYEDTKSNFTINYESGTENAYSTIVNKYNETVITFGKVTAETVYSISGTLYGNIIIDPSDDYEFELDLTGLTINAANNTPIVILSGDEVTLSAKKGTTNTINDTRAAVLDTDETQYSAAIYSVVDLSIGGKGTLTIVSTNNNGIHTKDDLEVKNLTLSVTCIDNALKGNDSVTIESGAITLISKQGDGIKTSNSAKKYEEDGVTLKKIQGDVEITGGVINIYAACDGIDAAHDVIVDTDSTVINIYTDKYSEYSEEVTDIGSGNTIYLRTTSASQKLSVCFETVDGDKKWVNAVYYTSKASQSRGWGGTTTYYYYQVEVPTGYAYCTVYYYNASQEQGQSTTYQACSQMKYVNENYDTLALTISSTYINVSWTMFTQSGGQGGPGGMGGGMNDGNQDKGDYSTKGIKADNEIIINNGTITIKAYDDAIHTNKDVVLGDEDDANDDYYGTGNIIINGGSITCYSNDDGIHADGTLTINAGFVNVTNSYEGLEGLYIRVKGGNIGVVSKDDGLNATSTSGVGIEVSGGNLYVYAGGDGLDANSTTSKQGIVFSGGNTVVLQTSGGNSAIDTERGYTYTGGTVLALGSSSGMTSETINVSTSLITKKSLTTGSYVTVSVGGTVKLVIKMPKSYQAYAVYLGSASASITSSTSSTYEFDTFGVYWGN